MGRNTFHLTACRSHMANIILRPGWYLKESQATDYTFYKHRRAFLKTLGLGAIGLASTTGLACTGERARNGTSASSNPPPSGPLDTIPADATREGYPAARNPAFTVPERPESGRIVSSSYNNFYEFDASTKKVWPLTGDYDPFPWTIEVTGLVQNPQALDLDELIRSMDLEERLYRFRCVEAWSLTVPWTGFPLAKLIERCQPLSSATFVQFTSVHRPDEMPGIPNQPWYDWPYYEALRMDEAMNEVAFVATGLYGEPLTKQNGAPLRLVLPWKYGYKGPKAVTKIEFMDERPGTFWNDLQPGEYGFLSNVNPNVPHPRWSQATERFLLDENTQQRVDTMLFNGYGEWVADLYPDEPRTPSGPIVR